MPTPTPSHPRASQTEQLLQHIASRPLAIVASAIAAGVVAGVIGPQAEHPGRWLAGIAAVLVLLALQTLVHRRQPAAERLSVGWLHGFRASVALHGSAWGVAAFWLFPTTLEYRATLALVLVGVASAGASRLNLDRLATCLFVLPTTVPMALRMIWTLEPLAEAVGAMMLVHAAFLFFNARSFARARHEALSLRADADQRGSALRQIEELMAQTGELARVGGWEMDLADGTLRVTDQTRRTLELPPGGRLTPARVLALFAPADRLRLLRSVCKAMRRGQAFTVELPLCTASGRGAWVCTTGVASLDGGGVKRLRGALQDVSERRAVQARLLAAKESAEAASRAKSAFLSNMSHEIRTPLHGLLGMLEMLATTPLSAEQARCIGIMRRSGHSLLALIGDILDLSKIEAGKLEIEQRAFDLRATVQATLDLMAPMAAQKQLDLRLGIDAALPAMVLGDALRLQQVLNNLVGNAIKFTSAGSVDVQVAPAPALGPGGLSVCVADTGPGIAPQHLARLFEPFAQGDDSTARRFGGSGLGLSIARRIAVAMRGGLDVSSTLGQGSVFRFTAVLAPVASADATAPALAAASAAPATAHAAALGRGRALLVEDNEVNQLYAAAVLRHLGWEVDVADDGERALVQIEHGGDYDVVLMDCQMPGMDGFEATRRIRAADARGGRPPRRILALTASALTEDRQRCLDSGMDAVLSKPFTIDGLRGLLCSAAGRPARRRVEALESVA